MVSRQLDRDFRLLVLVRIFQCPYVTNRWFVTHPYASLAPCARPITIAKPKTNPSCVRYPIRRRLISNLRTCRIGCEVGLDSYERAVRASIDYNFQAIHIPYGAVHIFPIITSICQRFRTSRCIVLCENITIYVKLLIKCKLLSVGNAIKTSDSSGWCEYFNVPKCQTVGL